jgi:hypothetical protein
MGMGIIDVINKPDALLFLQSAPNPGGLPFLIYFLICKLGRKMS